MIVFVFILLVIILTGLKVAPKDEFFGDYLSPKNTATINGIFSVLIFLSHAVTYVNTDGVFDQPYLSMKKFMGQLVVVTYLFFSGYGIMESIKKKGTDYVKKMPVNRFFRLWYHFAFALILYTVVKIGIVGAEYSLKDYLLAYTGYKSIGNSNWYMFVTFAMYIIIICSFLIFKKSKVAALASVSVLTVLFAFAEYKIGLPGRYYNTVICFVLGMVYSEVKPYTDKLLMKNDIVWSGAFVFCVAGFIFFSGKKSSFVCYELFVIFGALLLLTAMMKMTVKSAVLDWFGNHIFSFFILQRIPMILLKYFGYTQKPYMFIAACFFATVLLAVLFDYATEKIDGFVFGKINSKRQNHAESA